MYFHDLSEEHQRELLETSSLILKDVPALSQGLTGMQDVSKVSSYIVDAFGRDVWEQSRFHTWKSERCGSETKRAILKLFGNPKNRGSGPFAPDVEAFLKIPHFARMEATVNLYLSFHDGPNTLGEQDWTLRANIVSVNPHASTNGLKTCAEKLEETRRTVDLAQALVDGTKPPVKWRFEVGDLLFADGGRLIHRVDERHNSANEYGYCYEMTAFSNPSESSLRGQRSLYTKSDVEMRFRDAPDEELRRFFQKQRSEEED